MSCLKLISICLMMMMFNYFSSEACLDVEIVPRGSWMDIRHLHFPASTHYRKLTLPVYHIIIAHTATPECWNLDSCSIRMRNMQNHINTEGFPDIGFNFVIGGDGRAYEGTGFDSEGAHTEEFNSKSLGIAFIGDFSNKSPSNNTMTAARKLIVCAIQRGIVSKSREIHGARDATCTTSPGNALYELIKTWPRFKGGPLPGYKC